MNRIVTALLMTAGVASFVSCTESTRRGIVVMRLDDIEAHVGLGAGEVAAGDRLTLFRYVCTGTKFPNCVKKAIGSGEVTRVLNGSYSIARFSTANGFREGDLVEKAAAPQ